MLKFFKRLIKDIKRKVFIILDNLSVHHVYVVRQWVAKHSQDIEVYYLSACSPDLNPDEYLNGYLKSLRSARPARNEAELRKTVRSHMRVLQEDLQ
jgi:hypothetical protein